MSDQILIHGLQYGIYALEALVCVLLARRGLWRQRKALCVYVSLLFVLDGVARPAVLNYYGVRSAQFSYFYWLTDVVLALGAFLLTCSFFRRASGHEARIWGNVRRLLIFVFFLVVGFSALSLTRNYSHLFSGFIIEFSQNLYFSCLVLNTFLYLMIMQLAIDDDELGLLVCGMGVQFAGEAAGLALYHLTLGEHFATLFFSFLNPACTLGMLLIWIYAILKATGVVPTRSRVGSHSHLMEAVVN
jgi:hypothetical protein